MLSINALAAIIFCEQINGKCMVHNNDDDNLPKCIRLQKSMLVNGDINRYN